MSTSNAVIGERIASLRATRGITQADLASELGLEHKQVVSSLEKGERALKATELVRLGEIFHVSPLVILGLGPLEEQPFVLWRQSTDEQAQRSDEAKFIERCRRFSFLERLAGQKPAILEMQYDCDPKHTSYEQVVKWADQTRKALGFGNMPAPGLQSALENQHRIKIFVTDLKGGSGATFRSEFGDAVLVNAREPLGRRAFSLAHELFHIFTWDSNLKTSGANKRLAGDRAEKLADNFAAAFVLPREALEVRLPASEPAKWQMMQWVELARDFGVTVPALAWRLVNLGKLKREQANRIGADPARAGAGCRTGEAQERPLPDRYVMLAFRAYIEEEISIGKLAELLETNVGMLRKVLADYGFDLDSDVWQAKAIPA